MDKSVLNKLKSKAFGFANAAQSKASSLADTARTRVELTMEEQKLKSKYQSLGQKLYGAIQGNLLDTMKEDPSVVEIIGGIEEAQKKIKDLDARLKGSPDATSEESTAESAGEEPQG